MQQKCSIFVKFLNSLQDKRLESDVLFYLFDQFSSSSCLNSDESSSKPDEQQLYNDRTLLELEKRLEITSLKINLKIIYSTLLSTFLAKIEPKLIVDNHERVLEFCHCLLRNVVIETDRNIDIDADESIHLTLSLISVFTTGLVPLQADLKNKLKTFVPLLEKLKTLATGNNVADMAESLLISIGTHCAIKTNVDRKVH